MPELFLRAAAKEDIPRLNSLVNSAYRGISSKAGWTTEADFLEGIRVNEEGLGKMLNEKNAVILVGLRDENIIACVFLQKLENNLYLGMLTVAPGLQDQGYGKLLLQAAEKQASKWECAAIVMNVITLRKELINWYERHGYHITPERKPFPKDPRFGIPKQELEFLVMKKEINKVAR
ncbi:MAG: GNAT family N-acetyltransferase [Flavisolibacter sp.]|jgi:ribosomal protein S18 acetylase RimI-like enzyme|nr:GNAT family N-acetyltransferase [Flavisolibacter sp.]